MNNSELQSPESPSEPAPTGSETAFSTNRRLFEGPPYPGEERPEPPPAREETEEEAFRRLARFTPLEYDKVRSREARWMKLRVKTLDKEVARRRADQGREAIADAVKLPEFEPWPEPVGDAPELFRQVAERYSRHIVLPPGAADAMGLWTGHPHLVSAFPITPRLNLLSPKGGCGKTTSFDVMATMVPRALRAESMTSAVLFRVVDQQQPTLLLDEVDTYLTRDDELRGLLNAGHKRGACVYRCEGPGKVIRAFKAFAPAALAGIGRLPDTLRDRSILIPLVEAKPGEVPARFDPHHTEVEHELGRKLARWAEDNFAAVQACEPTLPPGVFNRAADNWRPLLALAEVVGGDWPARAREAFQQLKLKAREADPEGQLLRDARQVFVELGVERMFSTRLVEALRALPERGYNRPNGEHLTERRLAWVLKGLLGVRPHTVRIGEERGKGYERLDLAQ